MIAWLKQRLGQGPPIRHCRQCGAVVAAGAGICPRCHGMDIENAPPNARQQRADAAQRAG
jgi:hypothetical protein